jgi:glycosyltransferase involved in cell wall biosynthesis
MSNKKILIVSASFYPENSPRSFRATELAKEFARQGHNVTVITHKIPEIHNEYEKKYNLVIKDLGKRKWKSITLKGTGIVRLCRRIFLRFSMLLFEYPNIELFWMVKKVLKKESEYNLLISIAVPYPVHWGVAGSLAKSHRVAGTWIADCGDPYVGRENDTFKVPFYFRFIEKWFMRKADYISVPTRGAIGGYFPEFQPKIKIISQGFRFEDYQFESKIVINSKPIFAYSGGFIPGRRDPSEFIAYLKKQTIDFEFHIYTTTPEFIPNLTKDERTKIIVHNPVPRQELLKNLSQMDFLINFENIGGKQTPSKLIDYLILGKPILSIKTGSLDINLIKEFLSGNYKGKMLFEDPEQYHIENVCEKFIQLIN